MFDDLTLTSVFAVVALVLLALFYGTFRATRSDYSFSWTVSLGLLAVGSCAYLSVGTGAQVWAIPVGHTIITVGLVWSWRAARSLRNMNLRAWHYALPAVAVGLASAFGDPARHSDGAGAPVLFAAMSTILALAARDLHLADSDGVRAHFSLVGVTVALSVFYFARLISYLARNFDSSVIAAATSETSTTFVTLIVIIVVSFSMAGLSRDQVELHLRAGATKSALQLSEGAQVQQNFRPPQGGASQGYSIAGACVPSQQLSGDFFDWGESVDGLTITVGDVMGKGAGPAMIGATIRAGLRVAREKNPAMTVTKMIAALGSDLHENDTFVTLLHCHVDYQSGDISILDAGHGLALIARGDATYEFIGSRDVPLGLELSPTWDVQTSRLEPGDRLVIFSDGVLDLFDGSGSSIGYAAEFALADQTGRPSVQTSVERVASLAEASTRDDDITVVVVERSIASAPRAATFPNEEHGIEELAQS